MLLGHCITTEKVHPDPSKVKAILKLQEPTCLIDIDIGIDIYKE